MERPSDIFFPTYERLRPMLERLENEVDLLALEPVATSSMAAVVLYTRMLVRREWSEEVEISQATFERLRSGEPPIPAPDELVRYRKREHRYHKGGMRRVRCTTCVVKGGYVKCEVCDGSGKAPRYLEDVEGTPCSVCSGAGFAPCHVCGATGQCCVVNVHHATDSPIEDRRVIVPSLVGDLDDKVARAIAEVQIPSTFAIELEPTMITSAYRGAMSTGKPELFGFDYLDAWDRARASLPRTPPNAILHERFAFGWPFLCVRWLVEGKNVDVGIVANEHGVWRAVFATPSP